MNVAVAFTGVAVVATLAAAVALFVVEQSAAAWTSLIVGLFGVLTLLGMIVSTGRADTQARRR